MSRDSMRTRQGSNEQKVSKTQAESKQNTKQCGSTVVAKCPYYDSAIGKTLTCSEGIPIKETQAITTFRTKKQRVSYMSQYCCSDYRSCALFQSAICPYNDGVECNWKDRCSSCSWNPDVSRMMLLKFTEAEKRTQTSTKH